MKRVAAIDPLRFSVIGVVLLLTAVGCGSSERAFIDHSRDPEAYAATVKKLVHWELPKAKSGSEPEDTVQVVVQGLEDYQQRPVGADRDTYAQLLQQSKELLQMLEQEGNRAATNAKTDEIIALADTLPGEVHRDRD